MREIPGKLFWRWSAALLLCLSVGSAWGGNDLLWRIDDAQGQHLGWLMGTIHSDDERVLDLPAPVLDALESSRTYVWELRDENMDPTLMLMAMMLPGGGKLVDLIGEADMQRVRSVLERHGYPALVADHMKPAMAALLMSYPPPRNGLFLDLKLKQLAQARGLSTTGLEEVAEQLGIFDALSGEESVRFLRATLNELEAQPEWMERLHRAYLARDLDALAELALANSGLGDYPDLEAKLFDLVLHRRNRLMAERLQPLLKQGDVFVAVGALHLAGDGGLVDRLRDAGYELSPVH
ncbi:MAG: TraB/GumN family protein [Gammaproteobacteria bacterium]